MSTLEQEVNLWPVNVRTDTPVLGLPDAIFNSMEESTLNWGRLLHSAKDLLKSESTTAQLLLSGMPVEVALIKIQNRVIITLQTIVNEADIEYVLSDLILAINEANKSLPQAVFEIAQMYS